MERLLVGSPARVLVASLLVILFCSSGLYRTTIDTSVDNVLPGSHPLNRDLEDFKKTFGSDEKIIIGVKSDDLFSPSMVAFLTELSTAVSQLPEVAKVVSLANLKVPYSQDGRLYFKPAVETEPELLLSHPLFRSTLVSDDGKATLLQLYPDGEWSPDFPGRLLSKIKEMSDDRAELFIAGLPVIEQEVVESIYHDLFSLPLVVGLVLILFLLFIWRDFICTALCLGGVLLTLTGTLGLMGWASKPITVLTPVLPPLLMAGAVASGAHVLSAMKKYGSTDLKSVLQVVFSPCLFAALTTGVGFGSLVFNPVVQVKEFGFFALTGIFLSFFIVYGIITPLACLIKIKMGTERSHPFIEAVLYRLNHQTQKFSRTVVIVFSSIMCVLFIFLPGLKVDISVFDNVDQNGEVYRGYQFFQEHFSGVSTLEIDLKIESGVITQPSIINGMQELADELEKDARVNRVISVAELVNYMQEVVSSKSDGSELTEKSIGRLLFLYKLAGYSVVVDDLINRQRDRARLSIMVGNLSAKEFYSLSEKVKRLLRSSFPPDVTVKATGTIEMYSQLNRQLFKGLVTSLVTAFVLIGLLLVIFLRTIHLGLIAFLPNAFPLLIIYGTMRLFDLPIDIQTAMVGCISLGISVDGTVHFLHNYKRASKKDAPAAVVGRIWQTIGVPVFIATLALIAAFFVLVFSSFRPIQLFGILSTLGLIAALGADLVYLPALLLSRIRSS